MPTGAFGTEKKYRNMVVQCETVGSEFTSATATAGAATCSDYMGRVTSEALTTAQNAIYTLTITNTKVAAADLVFASVHDGTNTQGTPMIVRVTPAAGSIVITVANKHASAEALNGTIVVDFFVVKAI
jgi:hypothetical protein